MEYSFAQAPRPVHGGTTKTSTLRGTAANGGYRPAHRMMARSGSGMNIMNDPRVVRGNTYSGVVIPGNRASSGPAASAGLKKTRKKLLRHEEPQSIFDIRPEVERQEAIDLSAYLVAADDEDVRVEHTVETQTDKFAELPPPAPYVPRKTGVDVSTQIEPEDNLFKFDLEVEPILEVLVGKTLEQSLQEVQEEVELESLRTRKATLHREREEEQARIREMERAEHALWQEKERVRLAELDRVAREEEVTRKVHASYMAKEMVQDSLVNVVMDRLESDGVFRDPTRASIEDQFMPWVLELVGGNLDKTVASRQVVDSALQRALAMRDQAGKEVEAQREAAEARAAEPERRKEEEEARKGVIRIMVDGIDGVGEIGPIPVSAGDTIQEVEQKVQDWIRDNVGDFDAPAGGLLKLAFQGKELVSGASLLEQEVPDGARLEVPTPPAADADDEPTEEADPDE